MKTDIHLAKATLQGPGKNQYCSRCKERHGIVEAFDNPDAQTTVLNFHHSSKALRLILGPYGRRALRKAAEAYGRAEFANECADDASMLGPAKCPLKCWAKPVSLSIQARDSGIEVYARRWDGNEYVSTTLLVLSKEASKNLLRNGAVSYRLGPVNLSLEGPGLDPESSPPRMPVGKRFLTIYRDGSAWHFMIDKSVDIKPDQTCSLSGYEAKRGEIMASGVPFAEWRTVVRSGEAGMVLCHFGFPEEVSAIAPRPKGSR